MDLFNKIADDLTQFPQKLKTIKLYGFGEPLLNRNLPQMVSILKELNVTDRVETTTNGWWLEPATSDKLIAAGMDRIVISVNGLSSTQIECITKARVNFEKYVENIRHLYDNRGKCTVHIKTTNIVVDNWEDHFYNTFGDICDEISIENVAPLWPGIESSEKPTRGFFNDDLHPVDICPYIFYHMTVQANGMVSSCFIDWDRKNIIGDIGKKSLIDIWNGEELKCIRKNHLLGCKYKYEICKDCKQLIYGSADDVKRCALKIYQKL
jgi:radical SAM protein with 4Fe4S-binding SPASM domain